MRRADLLGAFSESAPPPSLLAGMPGSGAASAICDMGRAPDWHRRTPFMPTRSIAARIVDRVTERGAADHQQADRLGPSWPSAWRANELGAAAPGADRPDALRSSHGRGERAIAASKPRADRRRTGWLRAGHQGEDQRRSAGHDGNAIGTGGVSADDRQAARQCAGWLGAGHQGEDQGRSVGHDGNAIGTGGVSAHDRQPARRRTARGTGRQSSARACGQC